MERKEESSRTEDEVWNIETVPKVMKIVSTVLPQRDLISVLLLSHGIHRTLTSDLSLWMELDLQYMDDAGDRLVSALSLLRYRNVRHINLDYANLEDKNLQDVKSKCGDSLQNLETLDLFGSDVISNTGIEAITSICPKLKGVSIYFNFRVTDAIVMHLVRYCKLVIDLKLIGCRNITDQALHLIADNYHELDSLSIAECTKLTDSGLQRLLLKCSLLQSLNLCGLSELTDEAYKKLSLLPRLKFLDLGVAMNLTDDGLSCIASCKRLVFLNLEGCKRVTDVGIIAIAQGCMSLQFLSLYGIAGVTDKSLEALSRFCSNTLITLDVNDCIGIKNYSQDQLLKIFPNLKCFELHSQCFGVRWCKQDNHPM